MNDIDRYIRKLLVIFMILPFYLTACESERVNEADVMTSTDEDEMALTDDTARDEAIALPLDEKKTVKTGVLDATEQTHTDTLRDRLSQFNLPDPNPETNNLPSSLGVFTGEEWGWYFTEKFEELTSKGAVSELEALYVGAFIEELDMRDIAICPEIMIERGYPIPCGLEYTDEEALQTAYRSLISGSESHLRAYVGQIEAVIGVGNYKAQYLSQTEVDTILGR